MIILASTSDKVQVISSAAAALDVHASWLDNASGTVTPGRTNTAITTATTTDVLAPPASGTLRNLETLHIRNKHATNSCDVTVQHTDGTIAAQLHKVTLAPGAALEYIDRVGFAFAPGPAAAAAPTGLVYLTTLTANASASLDDTADITAAYDQYMFELVDLIPATNVDALLLQFQVAGAFQTTSYIAELTGADNQVFKVEGRTDSINLSSNNSSFNGASNTGQGISGTIFLHSPNNTTRNKKVTGNVGWQTGVGSGWATAICGGIYTGSTGAVTGVRFKFLSGNITSGLIRVYGIRTS